jgi:hypothetical protein
MDSISINSSPSASSFSTKEKAAIPNSIVPPRKSSLIAPVHHAPCSSSSPKSPVPKHAISPVRSRNVNSFGGLGTQVNNSSRDGSRLRIQHRPTASSSEPSLVHDMAESRVGEHES